MAASLKEHIAAIPDPNTQAAMLALLGAVKSDLDATQSSSIINASTLAIGSTPTNVSNTAFQFRIAGVTYAKAAVAAGTALGITDTINTGTAAGFFYGGFMMMIVGAGTVTFKAAATNQVYTSEAAAYNAILATAPTANTCVVGYFVVKTKTGAAWIAGTDDLTPASDCTTVTYYSVPAARQLTA